MKQNVERTSTYVGVLFKYEKMMQILFIKKYLAARSKLPDSL